MYVAIDGYDGTGKTTLINLLLDDYKENYSVSVERLLPITISLFKKYTKDTNDYLYTIDEKFRIISYLWESYIRLNLHEKYYSQNDIVFFDRWIFTNLTKKMDFGVNNGIVKYLIDSIPKPELLILIKMDFENIMSHLQKKEDWMLSFFSKDEIKTNIRGFYEGYENYLDKKILNYLVVDGNKEIHQVKKEIKKYIDLLLKNRR